MSVTNDYLEVLYKDLYKSGLERSDKLDTQVNLPTAIVTGLLAVSAFYVEHFPRFEARLSIILFMLSLAVYGFFLLASVYCLIKSYFRYQYQLVPPPGEIDNNVMELKDHYEGEFDDKTRVDEHVKGDIQRNIIDIYKDSASFNRHSNITRIGWLHWTTRWIIYSIITLVISRGVYYYGIAESKPQEIKITGMPDDVAVHRVEMVGSRKVELTNAPTVQRIQVVNPPQVQRVEITRPEVQKIEIVEPKKEVK